MNDEIRREILDKLMERIGEAIVQAEDEFLEGFENGKYKR